MFSAVGRPSTPRRSLSRSRASSVVVSPPRAVVKTNLQTQRDTPSNVLVSDANHHVSILHALPTEVQSIIDTHTATDAVQFHLSQDCPFAFLLTKAFCYAWNNAKKSGQPTVYRLACPQAASYDIATAVFAPLPLASFIVYPSAREPGLILVSSTNGDIRVWDALSMALTGADRYISAKLNFDKGEIARTILALGGGKFMVSTSSSKLFKITISFSAGRAQIDTSLLSKPRGMLSRLGSSLFFGGSVPLSSQLGYIALSASFDSFNERKVLAVKSRSVEAWSISIDGSNLDRYVEEWEGLDQVVRDRILTEQLPGLEQYNLDLRLEDAKAVSSSNLVILFSHASPTNVSKSRSYCLLDMSANSSQPTIDRFIRLHFASDPDLNPLTSPKLHLLSSAVVFVVFLETVIIKTSGFEELVALKPINRNKYIGCGLNSPTSLQIATARNGVLKIEAFPQSSTQADVMSPQEAKTAKLTARLERAVFFSDKADNPLSFELGISGEGDIASAAESVSESILSSESHYLPIILDMRMNLAERSARLKTLIILLNEHDMFARLSQTTRRQLAWDADRLAAASALWHVYNSRTSDEGALLANSITRYMHEHGEEYDDYSRAFFKNKLMYLGTLLEDVDKTLKTALNSVSRNDRRAPLLLEASQLWLAVYHAVTRQRETSSILYHVDAHQLPIEAWTSRTPLIEAMQFLFEANFQVVVENARDRGVPPSQDAGNATYADLKSAMTELAEYLLSTYEERLLFLSSSGSLAVEERVIQDRYLDSRPKIVQMLVTIGRSNHAYALAERHNDFEALVALCQDPIVGSAAKTAHFIDKYKENFAFALYDWLIAKDQLATLLTQEDAHAAMLEQYFSNSDNSRIAWLHDLSLRKFETASRETIREASKTEVLAERKLLLCISKLAQIANAQNDEDLASAEQAMEAITVQHEFVVAQSTLNQAFLELENAVDRQLPVEKRAQKLANSLAPSLCSKKAFQSLLRRLVETMLRGLALSLPDLFDAYTLQETAKDPHRSTLPRDETDIDLEASIRHFNFGPCLQLISMAQDLPTALLDLAIKNLWRRVYLRDNWEVIYQSSNYTDEELAGILRATALYHTLQSAKLQGLSPVSILSPAQALYDADEEVLKARFPQAGPQELQALYDDFLSESEDLQHLINSANLEQSYQEVVRLLASSEIGTAQVEDIEMS